MIRRAPPLEEPLDRRQRGLGSGLSSRMAPLSSSGTLKSTRRKTRLPLTSRSGDEVHIRLTWHVLGQVDERQE